MPGIELVSVDDLIAAVGGMRAAHVPDGYVIDSGETDDHPTHDFVYCHRHAQWTASRERKRTRCEMYISNVSWGEADSSEYCAHPGCDKELDVGSLTDYGVDSALALTETDPFTASVTPYELKRSAMAMRDDDPRWGTWILQALRVVNLAGGVRMGRVK